MTLDRPHWEAILRGTRNLLEAISGFSFCRRFYLGGGTALALRLGHRQSYDLDFFSETDQVDEATRSEILRAFQLLSPDVSVVTQAPGDLTSILGGQRIGFYSYGYRLLEECDDLLNVRVAGLFDIAAMKLDALAGRGARRDFYDIYFLAQRFSLDEMLERAQVKYPSARDYPMMILPYLNDFRNADRDKPVETLLPVTWDEVKTFFMSEAQRLANKWFMSPDGKGQQ